MKNNIINRREFIKHACIGSLALNIPFVTNSCRKVSERNKSNVLFIAVDDLKPILGCYGDKKVKTPNIDRLAKEGTVFLNNHCQQAVCAPSRASLLSGLRPDKTQVWDLKTLIRDKNPEIVTMPQYFKKNGYQTAAVGKIFDLRSVDNKHDEVSWTVPYQYPGGSRWMISKERVSTEIVDQPEDNFMDGTIVNRGLELLRKFSSDDKPFFLAVGFKKPHLPFVAPKKYWDMYDRDEFEIHPFQKQAANAPEFAFQPGWELRNGYSDVDEKAAISEAKQKELIHGYYACVSFIDALVGKLLDALDSLGLKDNTSIVLWGDHGWHLGDHDMWCKHTNFEQSTRSPLILSDPNIKGGIQNSSPTEFVDIFPTLCELAHIKTPSNVDGVSLVPLMKQKVTSVKKYAVSQFHRQISKDKMMGYALRTERYRYVEWVDIDYRKLKPYSESKIVAQELYDYQKDPLETESLVDKPEYETVMVELSQLMKDFQKQQET